MFLIPVLDLRAGSAVRAVGGRRKYYRPLEPRSKPCALAQWYRDYWGLRHLYVADLDAIEEGKRHWSLYGRLHRCMPRLWLDLGLRNAEELNQAAGRFAAFDPPPRLLLALETFNSPEELRNVGHCWPRQHLVFSLELRAGRPLGGSAWPSEPAAIVAQVRQAGIDRLILLDLADVGRGEGVSTLPLFHRLRRRWPELRAVLGGGVASAGELHRLEQAGASAALVASILHQKVITPEEVARNGWSG